MNFIKRLLDSPLGWPFKRIMGYGNYYPGHPHSPVPSKRHRENIQYFQDCKGIELNINAQRELLNELVRYYADIPFSARPRPRAAYYYNNAYFSYSDAIIMYGMLRRFRPARIIELGSGYSSACIMDSCRSQGIDTELHCYDLDFERLDILLDKSGVTSEINRHRMDIRDIPLSDFASLVENDMLIIDSSHVSKYQSELHYLFFEVLPSLKPGVLIHLHDVFRYFEYPEEWIEDGIYWNEQYLLRAFLQYNRKFEIVYFSDLMENLYTDWFRENMPLCLAEHDRYLNGSKRARTITGVRGQSFWMRTAG